MSSSPIRMFWYSFYQFHFLIQEIINLNLAFDVYHKCDSKSFFSFKVIPSFCTTNRLLCITDISVTQGGR